jgi:two-component system KDP operon response regulator KdpE
MMTSRILVVDDEPQLRRALRGTLSAMGFLVDDAASGEAALEKLRSERFDLIVLDVNMSGIDGIETCRTIRAKSDTGILMLTVRDRAEDKIEAFDAGADGYVTKPFDVNELLARIRAILRRAPASVLAETRTFWLGEIEISFRDRQIRNGSRHFRLTPKELDLLHYFVTHADTVLAHEELLQAVWGPDYGSVVEYLRVFLNQLRKKLEPDSSHPRYLLTEPWSGYRLSTCGAEAGSDSSGDGGAGHLPETVPETGTNR